MIEGFDGNGHEYLLQLGDARMQHGGAATLHGGDAARDGGLDGVGIADQLAMRAGGFGDLGEIHVGREGRAELVFARASPSG